MKRHPLIIFFVLAYLFTWIVWFNAIAEAYGRSSIHIPGAFAFIGLSVAAVVTAALTGGRSAIVDLLGRWVRWRVHPVWYAVAILLTPLIALAALAIARPFGVSNPVGNDMPLNAALVYFATHTLLFLATEETAWRGFALPRLQARYTALVASLILGLLWGLWHTPLFLTPGAFQTSLPFFGFLISAVAMSIMHTWLFNYTRGSVLLAALFHAATDAAIAYTGVMTHERMLFWAFVALQVGVTLLIIWREGPAHLSRKPDQSGTIYPP